MPRYFLATVCGFWVPGALLYLLLRPRLDRATKRAFWINLLLFFWPFSFLWEYIYLWLDVWDFSEAWDPLLGWRIFGAPVEEFVFWFGAPVIISLVYLGFDWLDRRFFRSPARA